MITLDSPVSLASLPPSGAPSGARSDVPRVLVVDDDERILVLEATILKRAGLDVATATDGDAAWQALLAGGFDLLVTDYRMPGVSGVALIRQLRVAKFELPVVMVSASLDELDTERLRRDPWTRIHAFVCKPFLIPELLAAVRSALSSETKPFKSGLLSPV